MIGDRQIGFYAYRVVRDGILWRVARIDGACSRWERTESGRAKHWRSEAAARAHIDGIEAQSQKGGNA